MACTCVECGGKRKAEERGWVFVFAPPDRPRILYCPDCLAELVREASGHDEQDEDAQDD
jgi:hypothetical protein